MNANLCRPYIFVTNGGGKTEEERCLDLSRQLQMEVSPGQFICGHTPMREMAERYGTVLVVGGEGEKCRQVAEGYGFKDVWYVKLKSLPLRRLHYGQFLLLGNTEKMIGFPYGLTFRVSWLSLTNSVNTIAHLETSSRTM